ncbi:MAG: tautomerase [Arcobacter sp.]|nr:tautomerase [Arcobacter sp.]|tara:strand:+ start:1613 stop:2005 length:393 start_codon:yes stop_codon:yes gene_type:complete
MPHLQFEINKKVSNETKDKFVNQIRDVFSEVMDTGTDHIAISIREYDKYNLTIGRANPQDDICLMNLDIREGRTIEKRREIALRYMEIVHVLFKIDLKNQYITFTQHTGEDFHLVEKFLANWEEGEDPLA